MNDQDILQQVTVPLEGLQTGGLKCQVEDAVELELARVRRRGSR
jgi:hypothetical protein